LQFSTILTARFWSYNSSVFIERCKQAIDEVREEKKSIEANELPPQNGNGAQDVVG
jgi:hypothetical protein